MDNTVSHMEGNTEGIIQGTSVCDIRGTWRGRFVTFGEHGEEHSGNIRGTFGDRLRHSGSIRGTFRENAETVRDIRGTFGEKVARKEE
jgi:hypothetical protein